MKQQQRRFSSQGFTLIEALITLTIFALILTMGYQAIVSTAMSRNHVLEQVDRQQSLRATHRALSQAVASKGQIIGHKDLLAVDLTWADSPWLNQSQNVLFRIEESGRLVARLDSTTHTAVLLENLLEARFVYHDDHQRHDSWDDTRPPEMIELSWTEDGMRRYWRFLSGT